MCGRFTLTISVEAVLERFNVLAEVPALAALLPRYNVAPSQDMPAVTGGDRCLLRGMTWGLIPPWAGSVAGAARRTLINVRAESLRDKPGFRRLLTGRRCLVPADGFYEWQHLPNRARGAPFRFVCRSREPFAFAGVWTEERLDVGGTHPTFAIVTTAANTLVEPIHDRMPVILPRAAEERWLAADADSAELLSLLCPFPADAMTAYAVSPQVNSPRGDVPACIEALPAVPEPHAALQLLLPLE